MSDILSNIPSSDTPAVHPISGLTLLEFNVSINLSLLGDRKTVLQLQVFTTVQAWPVLGEDRARQFSHVIDGSKTPSHPRNRECTGTLMQKTINPTLGERDVLKM